ncbi:alcohol dehydrogenase [Secundilactobacillus silagincola]|uniref:alcohol dehydrogenase n=1 Tax=Secundilactobacillus silagincola TaxID=1714681 RepID=A0A1Z5J4G0_9LACO|nr:zinc-binding dehydrogenase [Secundilactobacillus silagincola]GAX08954.1 alcohol dehydrogenase [Secundilactobacillus silagincola]
MKAWRYNKETGEFGLKDNVPVPEPGPGEFRLKVMAAGMCGSDVTTVNHGFDDIVKQVPVTLGHEIAGIVDKVGKSPKADIKVGDHVVLNLNGLIDTPGFAIDGGYAPYCIGFADDSGFIKMPQGVSFEQAAVSTDAGSTAYHAVIDRGKVKAGMKVGIIGLGGLGSQGARFAVLSGADVYAAEPKDDVRNNAVSELGVKAAVSDAKELAQFKPQVIVDYAGFGTTTSSALQAVAPGGRVVQVGLGKVPFTFNPMLLMLSGAEYVGSMGSTKEDNENVLKYLGQGKVKPKLQEISFDQIGEGLELLKAGKVEGRLVVNYEKHL